MYRHRVVQALNDLVTKYGGGGESPIMRAVWFGLKQEVPLILQVLDSSEEAIRMIEDKLREVLGIEPKVEEVKPPLLAESQVPFEEMQAPKKVRERKPKKAAEVVVEPTEEE